MKTTEFLTKKALNSRTPIWAKNTFRITFAVTSTLSLFLAGTQIIEEGLKFELMLALKSIDALVFSVSKMFGVTEEK